jgi:hypothetical protein
MTREEKRHHEALAASLESTLPIQTFATLSFPGKFAATPQLCDTTFTEFISVMQSNTHQTIGFIRADERTTRNHIHVVLVAANPVDVAVVSSTWQLVAGLSGVSCEASTFQAGLGGVKYLLKGGEYSLSHNIHLFDRTTDPASLPSGERRTMHRIWSEEQ